MIYLWHLSVRKDNLWSKQLQSLQTVLAKEIPVQEDGGLFYDIRALKKSSQALAQIQPITVWNYKPPLKVLRS